MQVFFPKKLSEFARFIPLGLHLISHANMKYSKACYKKSLNNAYVKKIIKTCGNKYD